MVDVIYLFNGVDTEDVVVGVFLLEDDVIKEIDDGMNGGLMGYPDFLDNFPVIHEHSYLGKFVVLNQISVL